MFSSKNKDLWTPDDLFHQLDLEFGFEVDACASERSALCEIFFTKETDALVQDWHSQRYVVWMNPEYGDPEEPCKRTKKGELRCKKKLCAERGYHSDDYVPGIIDFMRKANEESRLGATVVALVPARTDTEWWRLYCVPHERRFVEGRLQFLKDGIPVGTAPFPSALIIMRPPPVSGRYKWHTAYPCGQPESVVLSGHGSETSRTTRTTSNPGASGGA